MALQYKTRGGSSPQGKPRVFFCCHPQDREVWLEPISREVLELQNCAVYYYDDEPVTPEDRALDLKQMQLFVMSVTTRLLTTENQGLTDFAFATEHHIPVLPLMQESGLEELFNQQCGDLQFLDKNNQDPTAIPYDEKLKKYLTSVLIGDELAKKIRAAFDAYIFLSYRKKDRKHAQELMRLIHRNDFCRDIAIWYDEFLTPGEDFNDAIKAALEKCGLFALVVTPNLINEINYIMRIEYPMAKEAGKPIVPLEMVPTDAEGLRSNYDGIPDSVATDEASLREALLRVAKLLAIQENDNDPEHNYFIGLAYLGGVDVEVDQEKALSLITFSANAGLPEAMETLVTMYRVGMGTPQDWDQAIHWQKNLVELLDRRWKADPSAGNRRSLAQGYHMLGNLLETPEEAIGAYQNALTHFEAMEDAQWEIAACYKRLANEYQKLGMRAEVMRYLQKNLQICQALLETGDRGEVLRDMASSYHSLGMLHRGMGEDAQACICFKQEANIWENALKKEENPGISYRLSMCYGHIAANLEQAGSLEEAAAYLETGILLWEALEGEPRIPVSHRDVLAAYGNLSRILERLGRAGDALKFGEKSLDPRKMDRNTALQYMEIAYGYGELEDAEALLRCCGMAIGILEVLADRTDDPEIQDDLALCCAMAGSMGDQKRLQKAIEIWSMLAEVFPENAEYAQKRDMALSSMEEQ